MSKNNLSGFRDFLPAEMIAREEMINRIKQVYERYGFLPLYTPAIERRETLQGKYGPEAEKLMYHFQDQGGRELALRYDLTVPLARVIGQYGSDLVMPFKRYQVAPVWRGESPQAGRYREFYQFDADLVGAAGVVADAEMVCMIAEVMKALSLQAKVRVNNRLILDGLRRAVAPENEETGFEVIRSIDKLDKIGLAAVVAEVTALVGAAGAELVSSYLQTSGSSAEKLTQIATLLPSEEARAGVAALQPVFAAVAAAGFSEEAVVFDPTIARGLDYYTGIIYETTLLQKPELGSVCSGGRYDKLIAQLGGPDLPAVGISVGVDRLFEALKQLDGLSIKATMTEVLIVNFADEDTPIYFALATELRRAGIAAEMYPTATKLGKQFKYADRLDIPWVLVCGEEEQKNQTVVLKDLASGDQQVVDKSELVKTLRSLLKKA